MRSAPGDQSFHSPHTAAVWASTLGSSVNVTLALPFAFLDLITSASALPALRPPTDPGLLPGARERATRSGSPGPRPLSAIASYPDRTGKRLAGGQMPSHEIEPGRLQSRRGELCRRAPPGRWGRGRRGTVTGRSFVQVR